MRSIPIPSAWQRSCRSCKDSSFQLDPSGLPAGQVKIVVELGLFRYFWLTLQVCVGKANLSGGAGGLSGKLRSIKKFTWCMKRSSGKAGIM